MARREKKFATPTTRMLKECSGETKAAANEKALGMVSNTVTPDAVTSTS